MEYNYVKFDCPCGKNVFEEVVYVGNDNVFGCPQCQQQIKVDAILPQHLESIIYYNQFHPNDNKFLLYIKNK